MQEIPESYEDYLRIQQQQMERDRDRFIGRNSHEDEPVYDARDGHEAYVGPIYAWEAVIYVHGPTTPYDPVLAKTYRAADAFRKSWTRSLQWPKPFAPEAFLRGKLDE